MSHILSNVRHVDFSNVIHGRDNFKVIHPAIYENRRNVMLYRKFLGSAPRFKSIFEFMLRKESLSFVDTLTVIALTNRIEGDTLYLEGNRYTELGFVLPESADAQAFWRYANIITTMSDKQRTGTWNSDEFNYQYRTKELVLHTIAAERVA